MLVADHVDLPQVGAEIGGCRLKELDAVAGDKAVEGVATKLGDGAGEVVAAAGDDFIIEARAAINHLVVSVDVVDPVIAGAPSMTCRRRLS